MQTECPNCKSLASTSLMNNDTVKDRQEFIFRCKGCGTSFGATLNLTRGMPANAQAFGANPEAPVLTDC